MAEELIAGPVFGVTLTLSAYYFGLLINRRTRSLLFHPMLIALVVIISVLLIFDIEFTDYNAGGSLISFLLGPATVALAIPMYRQLPLLKENMFPILFGIFAAAVFGVGLVLLLGTAIGTDELLLRSMVPKSVTTPIAIGIAEEIGAEPSVTVAFVILHGLLGGMFGPELQRLFGITSELARGLTLGITAHGIGTGRALTESDEQGALSGLAIGIMGLFTALTAPLIVSLF